MHTLSTAGTPAEGGTAAESPQSVASVVAPEAAGSVISIGHFIGSLAEAALVVDSSGAIVLGNPRAAELFGYEQEALTGSPISMLLPESEASRHGENVDAFFSNPATRPMGAGAELMAADRSGRVFPVEVSLGSLEVESGRLAIALVYDITERVTAAADLESRNRDLEEFNQVVAHDLNTMVTGIMGLSEVLVDSHRDLDALQLKRSLQAVSARSRDLARVIRELLIFARLDKSEVEKSEFSSRQVVVHAVGRLSFETRDAGAAIDIDPEISPAVGYAPWVEEVWYNLIANAIKHGGEHPEIRVRSRVSGGVVRFMVEDSGPGVPEPLVESLFDPESDRRGRIVKGHGLGLGIVARIIEKLDGRVGIDLPDAGGSVFWFELPAP